MRSELGWEKALAVGAMRMFPPTLRAGIVEQPDFQRRFDLRRDPVLNINAVGAQFRRSDLFDAARLVLTGAAVQTELRASQGEAWLVTAAAPFGITLARDTATCVVSEMACLSPVSVVRVDWFQQQAGVYAALEPTLTEWHEILVQRALADDELEPLLGALRLVPSRVSASLHEALANASFGPDDLVPSDIRYFDWLAAAPGNGVGLQEFFATTVASRVRSLVSEDPGEGLKAVFLLGSHSRLADLVEVGSVPPDALVRAFVWIASHGDRMSQVAAIECGLRLLRECPDLEPSLAAMARDIAGDVPDDPGGRLKLASGLAALVEGEVARRSVARGRPPFWRRLVTIAHACTVERGVLASGLDVAGIAKWALNGGGSMYYMQTLVDLRCEPRWFPEFMSAHQLKAEWIGRVWNAAERYRESVQAGELSEILWGDGLASVKSQLTLPQAWLPGPLEGGLEAQRELPAALEAHIRTSLEAEELTPTSFYGLVNASLLLRVESHLSGLAAHGLRRVRYQLRQVDAHDDAFPLLHGLATVAAVTRSAELAAEVRVLARAARRRDVGRLSPEACARIALIAAAANAERSPWGKCIGEWLTELAFSEMALEEAGSLQSDLQMLLHLEPDLWETCGRAEAALAAFVASASDVPAERRPHAHG